MTLRFTPQQLLWAMFTAFGGVGLMMVLSDPAFAQAAPTSANFSCVAGKASGQLIATAASCPVKLEWTNIFSFLVCHIETMTSQIFGNIYCGVILELQPAVKAVLTLAVVTFGVGFTIGVIPATGREFMVFLLKIVFVWAFATQADYMIGYGYNFLVGGLREGTVIAISGIIPPTATGAPVNTTADVYKFLDDIFHTLISFGTATAGKDGGVADRCDNALFAALAIMAVAFPPLFMLSLLLFFKMIMVFLRACFGYMFSIVGIAFLMTLSPIFLSFSLFKQTRSWFDKYLGYLASFTLQMVIVFTFIAMMFSLAPTRIMSSFSELIVPVAETPETASWRWPWEYCTLCKFDVVELTVDPSTGAKTPRVRDMQTEKFNLGSDKLKCKVGASTDIKEFRALQTSDYNTNDVKLLMEFTGSAILSLIVLAYVLDQLLHYVPSLAWRLASGMSSGVYAPQIGGGAGQGPGISTGPLELFDTAGEGFYRGYTAKVDAQGNAVSGDIFSSTQRGMADAGNSFLFGYETNQKHDPGLVNSFMRFFVNPTGTDAKDI